MTEPRLAPDRHDLVLALALGVLASTRRFERAVEGSTADDHELDPDDPAVLASLGVIALGRSIRRWLEHGAAPDRPVAPTPTAARPLSRELLR